MRNLLICTIVFFMFMFTAGCSREIVSTADELVMSDRTATTASGIEARLRFYDGVGELSIKFPQESQALCIRGTLAVDDKNFYIISQELKKTYTFSYKVYADRALVTYNGETLVFYNEEVENTN